MTKNVERSTRAVAYYRSTVSEGDESIETQREQVRKWAEEYGLDIVREFEDRNASQLHTEPPPGFEQLMRRVKRDRSFQFVLCADVSQWGRCSGMHLPEWYSNECLKAGKAVIYTKESDCDPPHPVYPMFLHFLRLQYNGCCRPGERIRRGLRHAAEHGYWTGGRTPYGMQRLLLDDDGNALRLLRPGERKTKQKHRVALVAGESAEVATIRRIFRDFVDRGHSTADIAKRLNAKGVVPSGGNSWTTRRVLTCLRNAAYAKPIRYRRKKDRGNETPDVWIHTPKASAGIVSLEQFRRAQELLT